MSDTLVVFLRENQESLIYHQSGEEHYHNRLWIQNTEQLFQWPASKWMEYLEEQAVNYPDDGTFGCALRDSEVFYSSGQEPKVRFARGDEHEMQRAVDLIFELEPAWLEWRLSHNRVGVQVILVLGKRAREVVGKEDMMCGGWWPEPHPRPELWTVWLRYFEPQLDEEIHRQEIADGRRLWSFTVCSSRSGEHHYGYDYDERPIEFSAHERLEQRFELSDWLRNRVGLNEKRISELLC